MKSIKSAMPNQRRPFRSADDLLNEIMQNVSVKAFQKDHPSIPIETYKKTYHHLSQYVKEKANCLNCTGLENCQNRELGHESYLVGCETYIDLKTRKCPKLKAFEKMKESQELMKSHRVPKNVLSATFETMELDNSRILVINEAIEYCDSFQDGQIPNTGLYLYGSFGVGKSHIAAAIANTLTKQDIDVFMIYVPDFFQSIYETFNKKNTSYQELIYSAQTSTVLILDDIGAENLNQWVRDQIMGPILQYRMTEGLPTVFTSNLTLDELEDHFATTSKGGTEKIKALRIMERIRHSVKPLEVIGKNRRVGRS